MSTPPEEPPADQSPPDEPAAQSPVTKWTTSADGGQRFWVIPLATFVVGLVLGGGIIALSGLGSDDDSTADADQPDSTPSASPSPTSTGPDSVTIPGDCIQIATDAQELLDLADQAVTAAGDLDADALSDIVAELRTSQETLSNQASICQEAAAQENPTTTP